MRQRQERVSSIERRRFLQYTWGTVGASLALGALPRSEAFTATSFGTNPFKLGVASGDPTSDGIVLWTRSRRDPRNPKSRETRPCRCASVSPGTWGMRHVVAAGVARAEAKLAHSVHVEVDGLRPGRDYFYQFDVRDEESPVGHFRTAPDGARVARRADGSLSRPARTGRAATTPRTATCCQNDLDLVLHLGDYTYEYAIGVTTAACRSRRFRRGDDRPAHVPAPAHALQARS